MTSETNRRAFVQGAGLAAPILLAAASPLAAAAPATAGARGAENNGGTLSRLDEWA